MAAFTKFGTRTFASAAILAAVGLQSAEAQPVALEEIIVTARRTNESLQDVPLAVSALTSETLQDNNIHILSDLNGLAPSLNYAFGVTRTGTGAIFFRGLTNGAGGLGTKASVFIDGDYIATNSLNTPYNFMERVETLPGPQSAQFGRATFGGALNYVTKSPTKELAAVVHADYGQYGDMVFDALISGPIARDGDLRGLIFAAYNNYDAPKDWSSLPDPLHPNGVRSWGQNTKYIAGKLEFDVTDDLTLRATGMYSKVHDDPTQYWLLPPNDLYLNGSVPRYTNFDITRPIPGAQKRTTVGALHAEDLTDEGLVNGANYDNIPDPTFYSKNPRLIGNAEWNVLDGHTLKFNINWEKEVTDQGGADFDFSNYPGTTQLTPHIYKEATALELRFSSPDDQRLRYAAGLYHLRFNTNTRSSTITRFRCISNTATNFAPCIPLTTAAANAPVFANGNLVGFSGVSEVFNTRTETNTGNLVKDKSVFGMLTFDITEALNVAAEGRYQEERLITNNRISGFLGDKTFKAFVPRINMSYKFNDDTMGYVLYSLGNNPGGFNPTVAQFLTVGATQADLTFKEEKLKNYEIGLKSAMFENRLTANIAAYHMTWKNQTSIDQRTATDNRQYSVIANRGISKVNGFEIDISAVPTEGLVVRGNMSYNRAKYSNYCSASAVNLLGYWSPGRVGCVITDGKFLENVAPMAMSLQADYTWELASDWLVTAGGTFRHRDGHYTDDQNLAVTEGQNKWDIRLAAEKGSFEVQLYCSNCGNDMGNDRVTYLGDARLGSLTTQNRSLNLTPLRPRQVGIRTTYTY